MRNRLIPLIATLGLFACKPTEQPTTPAQAEDAAPVAEPAPQVVAEPESVATTPASPSPSHPQAVRVRPAAKVDAPVPSAPPPPPTTEPPTDHSGHDMSAMPATPKQ